LKIKQDHHSQHHLINAPVFGLTTCTLTIEYKLSGIHPHQRCAKRHETLANSQWAYGFLMFPGI